MRRNVILIVIVFLMGVLVACGNDDTPAEEEELLMLEVDFIVPETADVDEAVKLEADVTYGDEAVTDADEVLFEIWEIGKEDESEKIDGKNNGDGTYSIEYTFDDDGVYEMYAHTTAHSLHTMPKKQITVGDGEQKSKDDSNAHGDHDEASFHTEGFDMHIEEPEQVIVDENTPLTVQIMMHEEPLENVQVRYEIWPDEKEDQTEWVDTTEDPAGEYIGNYTFSEAGTYHIQVHVKDDEDLHEHTEYQIKVQ